MAPDVQSGSAPLSHPKPKRHGALHPGLSTGLFHFISQQFVLSRVRHSHQKLPQFMNRSTNTVPLVLFKVSIAQSTSPSSSIHQARTNLLRCDYRFRNQCLNWAHKVVGSRFLQAGQAQMLHLTSPGAPPLTRGAEGHQTSLPSHPFRLHPSYRGLFHRGQP